MTTVLGLPAFAALVAELSAQGYQVIGPTVRDGAIVHAEISSIEDLPRGVTDLQQPGSYRLTETGTGELFGFASTATSWKAFLLPARRVLWTSSSADEAPEPAPLDEVRRALLGVRSCDLHAIAIQDTIHLGRVPDPDYESRRSRLFIVAVSCGHPGDTCFCVSMGTGPRPDAGYDIALTELTDGGEHRFLAEAGTPAGQALLAALDQRPSTAADTRAAEQVTETASASMGRTVDTTDLRDLLYANAEHPRWEQVASRCLSCTNCTLVCPTCFCVSSTDAVDLSGAVSRSLEWDSCFLPEHSHLPDGPVRKQTPARYRQWLTHKFASWIDQFGSSGCVGCGRCVTWCPAAIDVTEELAAIRATSLPVVAQVDP